jgi:hypothetical protein
MKKLLFFVGIAAVAGIIYFVLSTRRTIPKTIPVRANITAANRCCMNCARWGEWFPGKFRYKICGVYYNEIKFVLNGADTVTLRIAPLNQDSVIVGWQGRLSRSAGRQMDTVLAAFRAFAEDSRNIYGVRFQRTMTNDSTLITLSAVEASYPTT